MGIYIKDMEMPKNCDECYIREKDTCPLTKTNVTGWGIPLNCPLVEIPPHGRLGDLDTFESIKYELPEGQKAFNRGFHSGVQYVQRLIMDAPTIIEAEEGEHGRD